MAAGHLAGWRCEAVPRYDGEEGAGGSQDSEAPSPRPAFPFLPPRTRSPIISRPTPSLSHCPR